MAKSRDANLAKGNQKLTEKLSKIFTDIEKGFDQQQTRREDNSRYWDMYNCILGADQLYAGRNRLYAPFVYEAIEARSTRFTNQLFPVSDRHVEATSEDGMIPRASISMCEHYIHDTDLRQVIQTLIVAGDIEGQMSLYVDWYEASRRTARRAEVDVETGPGVSVGKTPDMVEEDEPVGGPRVELIFDADICVLPATSASVNDALCSGGHVAILRRWSKRQLEYMVDRGALDSAATKKIIKNIESYKDDSNTKKDPAKTNYAAAGIKKDGRGAYAHIYEIWTELEIDDEYRLCQVFMVANDKILMARRNPLWCDECPLLSVPVKRTLGSFKGMSQIAPVKKLQLFANDVFNEMADSANYTLLPITLRDPAYQTAPMILAPGAIWDVPPTGASFADMPPLWQHGADILQGIKAEIFQVLTVNAAMVPTQSTKKKLNQAEVAQEQQIDQLNTSDSTRVIKDGILNPLVNLFMALDYQYRDKAITVREYGEMGMKSEMERIPPFELQRRATFFWIGDEIIRSTQQVQQKVAFLNVMQNVPPDAIPHYQFTPEPILVDAVESIYGPRIARQALQSIRDLISVDPKVENQMLQLGHAVTVKPMDNPQEHIPAHQQSIQQEGDPFGQKQAHLIEHKIALQRQMMQQSAMQQGQQPGKPGMPSQPQGPGARPGAMPSPGRPAQQPPGAIHQDRMSQSDPNAMPRRMA
jgi:hypothetical protein